MKLYDVPEGSKIRVLSDIATPPASPDIKAGDILLFSRLDAMYSECFKDGERVHLVAWAEVEIIKEL